MFLALKLVWRQMRHEYLSPCCLCIAMAAAVVPLLLILGIKEGYVNTLRQRLAAEPANLEISIPTSERITPAKLKAVQALPGVGFCMPATRLLSVHVQLQPENTGGKEQDCGLIPTGPGDPFLKRYGLTPPAEGEIVISAHQAEQMLLHVGDTVKVVSSKTNKNGQICRDAICCRVAGILPKESGVTTMAYAPLAHLVAVEEYVEGLRAGINDNRLIALPPVYHGMCPDKAGLKQLVPPYAWAQACPFQQERATTAADADTRSLPPGATLFFSPGQFVTKDKLRKAYQLTKQNGATLYLWNPSLQATFTPANSAGICALIHCIPEPLSYTTTAAESAIRIECGTPEYAGEHTLHTQGKGSIRAQIVHNAQLSPGQWQATATVLGILRQVQYRGLEWDEQKQILTMPGRDFSRMRIYAKDIDTVEPLVQKLNEMGYTASGKVAEIQRIRKLNAQLEKLFILIAGICMVGASLSLSISLFNSARKRKRDYAILSAMGFSRRALTTFPVIESLILTLAALGLSFALFHGFSFAAEHTFADSLRNGEQLCYLSSRHYAGVLLCGMGIGVLSALFAAGAVLRTQPSTAIREI